jgi:F0F1-type ATP synthase assembly protein I
LATEKQSGTDPGAQGNTTNSNARTLTSVLELPVILVGSVLAGGGLGHLIDGWLHKDSLFTLILGGLGFAAGISEILRRLSREEKREEKGTTGKSDDN